MLDFETMVAKAHEAVSAESQLHDRAKAISAEVAHLLTPLDELCRQAGTQFRVWPVRNTVNISIGLGRGKFVDLQLEISPTHSIARLDDGRARSLAHYENDAELAEAFLDQYRSEFAQFVKKLVARAQARSTAP